MKNGRMQWRLLLIEVLDEGLDATLVFEDGFLALGIVSQHDAHP
jgi:hypothetical protein